MPSRIHPFVFRNAKLKQQLEKAGFDPNQVAKRLTESFAPMLLKGQTLEQIIKGNNHDT